MVVCAGADRVVCVPVEIRWCVRVPGTMQSDTAHSTVRENLREKLLSRLMLASIQTALAGTETMGGYSGSSEQHGGAMPVSGEKALAVSSDVDPMRVCACACVRACVRVGT